MKRTRSVRPHAGSTVVLVSLPPGFLRGLPRADKKAMSEITGKLIRLTGYDDDGRAELEFTDDRGVIHFVYVPLDFISSGTRNTAGSTAKRGKKPARGG